MKKISLLTAVSAIALSLSSTAAHADWDNSQGYFGGLFQCFFGGGFWGHSFGIGNSYNLTQAGGLNSANVSQSGSFESGSVYQKNSGPYANTVQGSQAGLSNRANVIQNGVGDLEVRFVQNGIGNSFSVNQGSAGNPGSTAFNNMDVAQHGNFNSIIANQFGNSNYALTGVQDGTLNSVIDAQNANFAQVDFYQSGTGNVANFQQAQSPTVAVPTGSVTGAESASIQQVGLSNVATINQSGGISPITGPTGNWGYAPGGTGETAVIDQNGWFNTATVSQLAPGEFAQVMVTGNSNVATVTQQGQQEVASVIINGSSNNVSTNQSGNYNTDYVTVNGFGNNSHDAQTGTNDTIIKTISGNFVQNNITQTGNNMSAVVTATH